MRSATVYSKEVLDKYFLIFVQTLADMIVGKCEHLPTLHSNELWKQTFPAAIFDRLTTVPLLIERVWLDINFLCLCQFGLISFLIESS